MLARIHFVTAATVFWAMLQVPLAGQDDADAVLHNSQLVNMVLQPEPEIREQEDSEPDQAEPAEPAELAEPPAPLFTQAFLGANRTSRVQRATNMYGDSMAFVINEIGAAGRFKIAENNNPLPADRVFFTYDHFHNAFPVSPTRDEHLDRYTVGIERTFRDGWMSAELRVRMLDGMDAVQPALSPTIEGAEFGNMALILKHLLWENPCGAGAVGLSMTFPTAPDNVLGNITIENEAFLLQPFFGWLYTPNDRLFFQAFAQLEFDTNGNPVTGAANGTRLNGQSLLFLDGRAGYWVYENPCARCVTGVAPFVELHYTTTLENADSFNGVGNTSNHVDILNLTSGLHLQLGPCWNAAVAVVVPLRDDEEHLFDTEVGIQINRYF